MTTRLQTIIALLITGAALAATPVFAADAVSGNRGPAEKPANRDAPVTLPGAISAEPTPMVDAASLSRGIFDLDPAAALAGLTAVTLSPGGAVVETPPSDALRGIFEDEIKGHKN